ncbi:MAG: AAA family ATPase [Anaerolineales bacterium]|nr:AAA family ATPase [Anaerolineales bacterium]
MKISLEKAIFVNRAPFGKLSLDFSENCIAVLNATNGKGKTTLLSHIADAFYEMARPHFQDFEDKPTKYYRVSSVVFNLDMNKPSFVYLRFKTEEGNIDYIDIRNKCTQEEYNDAINLDSKIPFDDIKSELEKQNAIKKLSPNFNKEYAEKIFNNNLSTYFPSYRYETPGYLNDPYRIKLDFVKQSGFSGYLKNPIEVITGLPQLANWIMDVILDLRLNQESESPIPFTNLNKIITQTLISNNLGNLRFGVGARGQGSLRIAILENKDAGKRIYPSIFNLSSGELAVLCIFGEMLRQADNNNKNISADEITGIVLIDEVDKHLHIKLQKEALPLLFNLFPKVQFIISSHSPFLSMGLAEMSQERSTIIDLESGLSIQPTNDKQYQEVYEMMIDENKRFKQMYDSIKLQIEEGKELQIITEGKNSEHIRKAISILDNTLLDKIKIVSGAESKSGDQQLKNAFDIMSNTMVQSKFLFVWDCDSEDKVNSIVENSSFFKFCFPNNQSNAKAKQGIENLYAEELFTPDVYDQKNTQTAYGGSKAESIFNKSKFLDKVKQETDKSIFENYKPLLEKIKSIIAPPQNEEQQAP